MKVEESTFVSSCLVFLTPIIEKLSIFTYEDLKFVFTVTITNDISMRSCISSHGNNIH